MSLEIGIKRLFTTLLAVWSIFIIFAAVTFSGVVSIGLSQKLPDYVEFFGYFFIWLFIFLLANLPFELWILKKFKCIHQQEIKKLIWFLLIAILSFILFILILFQGFEVLVLPFISLALSLPGWFIWMLYWVTSGFIEERK